jgi:hypothetical protein
MSQYKRGARLSPIPFAVAALLGLATGGAHADAIDDLKAKVDALQKEVADLKKQQSASGTVTAGATKGSFKLPGSDTSVSIGGYAKLDAIYSSRSAGVNSAADQLFDPTAIPVGPNAGTNERQQVTLHARQSRLFLRTATPTDWGALNTHLEFDLFGASGNESVSNSHNLRLRHAYGSLGGLLAGQTWSNYMVVGALPETLDFGGPAGQTFVRQAQVRWTQPFSGGQWSVALENPETVVARTDGTTLRADDDRAFDITGNFGFKTSMGDYSLVGLVRQVRIDSATPAARDSKSGGGVGVFGIVPVLGKDTLSFGVNAGNAIGRYWGGLVVDGFLDVNGRLDLPDQLGGFVAYRHFWNDRLRSTVALGALKVDNPSFAAASSNKRYESAHLNLIYSPVPNTNFGAEYIYGRRETEGGLSGSLNRLQASFQYSF